MISKRATYVIAAFAAVMLFSMLARPNLVPSTVSRLAPSRFMHKSLPIVDKTFLLLKTGADVQYGRLPSHFTTTMKRFPHYALYSDANDTIGEYTTVDCLSFLPESTINGMQMEGYRVRRQMREQHWNWGNSKVYVNGKDTGWDLDRFKNVPAFGEAWTRSNEYEWYVMIDADTYLSAFTLQEVTKGKNPDDLWYFGKAVGWDPQFAHGGSGIVLSRGAMKKMFGSTAEDMKKQLRDSAETASQDCCGDSVVARQYRQYTEKDPEDTLQHTEFGQFQGARIMNTIIKLNGEWCNPVGTFHGVQPWEVYLLDKWEKKCEEEQSPMLYADFYRDIVMPHIKSEMQNWIVYDGPAETNRRNWKPHDIESKDKHKCYEACLNDDDCTMWNFRGGEQCIIFRDLVIMGQAMNRYDKGWKSEWTEVTTGYMIDRIRDRRRSQSCDGLRIESKNPDLREGWFSVNLEKAGRDSLTVMNYESTDLRAEVQQQLKPQKEAGDKHKDHPHDDKHEPHDKPHDGPHDEKGPHDEPPHAEAQA